MTVKHHSIGLIPLSEDVSLHTLMKIKSDPEALLRGNVPIPLLLVMLLSSAQNSSQLYSKLCIGNCEQSGCHLSHYNTIEENVCSSL